MKLFQLDRPSKNSKKNLLKPDTILLTSTTAGALGLLVKLLPEAGIDPAKVQYAGLARWDVPAQTLALSGVQGGLFALPDYARAQSFSTRYEATFSSKPHQLAGLAYDGVAAIGALVARGTNNALGAAALTQTAGFVKQSCQSVKNRGGESVKQ